MWKLQELVGQDSILGFHPAPQVREILGAGATEKRESPHPYGTITTGAREKANFRPSSSTTLTWQTYLPGFNFANAV